MILPMDTYEQLATKDNEKQ